ncbi:MAG TPA: hypothetical protein VHE54_16890 [Puia sp.]|nr:hypothetical protein [Puia sp.]
MKRKEFIFLTVAGAAAIVIPNAGCRQYSDATVDALSRPLFLGQVCDAKTIGEIGAAYRTANPEESHRNRLIGLLLKDMPAAQDDHRLARLVDARVRSDFATDNIVTVKGWVLSRTEARQCALYSISLQ